MKNKILLIIVSLISISVFSQEYTQTLRGKITDADTYITLPGANITILGTNPLKGGTSDYDGNYVIENVPVGRHNIKVSYIGYEDVYFNEIELISGNELVLNVQMTEDISILKEVVITAKDEMGEPINSMVTLSAQRITIE